MGSERRIAPAARSCRRPEAGNGVGPVSIGKDGRKAGEVVALRPVRTLDLGGLDLAAYAAGHAACHHQMRISGEFGTAVIVAGATRTVSSECRCHHRQ